MNRDERIENYFANCFESQLAEMLVDAEDELEMWKAKGLKYDALRTAGVDNWEGYGPAVESLDG